MRCAECKWNYPVTYLAVAHTSKGNTGDICGICALEIGNKVLKIRRTEFTGEIAEEMRQNAIKWREKFPQEAPSEGIKK